MQITAPSFDDTEIELLKQCLDSGWVTQGPLTEKFEAAVAKQQQVRHALATTSCTAALHLAALALELGPGDEVLVPAFTWVTSAHAAEYVGAKAVFVDVDPQTYNIDPEALVAAITPNTRAIMAVHLFGLAADMSAIKKIATQHQLKIIEDAACALGTHYQNQPVGALGDIGCFSFHPRKVITTGEGGMLTTNSETLATKLQSLRNHGSTGLTNDNESHGPWTMSTFNNLGFNLRFSDIQAAVGVAQMAKVENLLAQRKQAAQHYSQLLAPVEELQLPTIVDTSGHTFQSYVIQVKVGKAKRNALMTALAQHNIQTRPGTHAVPRLGYYRDKYQLQASDFPNAVRCEDSTITLPIFPGMRVAQQQQVVNLIKENLCETV